MKKKKVQALIVAVFGFALAISYVSITPAYARHHCTVKVGGKYMCDDDVAGNYACIGPVTTLPVGCGGGEPE